MIAKIQEIYMKAKIEKNTTTEIMKYFEKNVKKIKNRAKNQEKSDCYKNHKKIYL